MYKLDFSTEGRASLKTLDKDIAQRVLIKLKWLVQNAEYISHQALKGDLSGLYKLKIGDWRVMYEIENRTKIITVHKVGHRREIYINRRAFGHLVI